MTPENAFKRFEYSVCTEQVGPTAAGRKRSLHVKQNTKGLKFRGLGFRDLGFRGLRAGGLGFRGLGFGKSHVFLSQTRCLRAPPKSQWASKVGHSPPDRKLAMNQKSL